MISNSNPFEKKRKIYTLTKNHTYLTGPYSGRQKSTHDLYLR